MFPMLATPHLSLKPAWVSAVMLVPAGMHLMPRSPRGSPSELEMCFHVVLNHSTCWSRSREVQHLRMNLFLLRVLLRR